MGMKNSVSYEERNKSSFSFFYIFVMQQRLATVSRESRTLESLSSLSFLLLPTPRSCDMQPPTCASFHTTHCLEFPPHLPNTAHLSPPLALSLLSAAHSVSGCLCFYSSEYFTLKKKDQDPKKACRSGICSKFTGIS